MSNNKEKDRALESLMTLAAEWLLQTMSMSTQWDPFRMQEQVSEAITDVVNNKLQLLVVDMIRSAQQKGTHQQTYRGPQEVGVPSPTLDNKWLAITI